VEDVNAVKSRANREKHGDAGGRDAGLPFLHFLALSIVPDFEREFPFSVQGIAQFSKWDICMLLKRLGKTLATQLLLEGARRPIAVTGPRP
jgi:hypothetical protein